MSTTSWGGKDGSGNPITFNAEQPNPGGPLTPHFVLEIAGAPVAAAIPVKDSAAETSLATIAANGATAANQETAIASLATIAAGTPSGVGGSGISQPAGGTGIQGWLSGIFKALTGNLNVTDSSGAAYQGSSVITPGTAAAPGRSVGYVCTTAGNITITLPDGSTMTFGISASADLQTLPFAVTLLTLNGSTAGSFWTLK